MNFERVVVAATVGNSCVVESLREKHGFRVYKVIGRKKLNVCVYFEEEKGKEKEIKILDNQSR